MNGGPRTLAACPVDPREIRADPGEHGRASSTPTAGTVPTTAAYGTGTRVRSCRVPCDDERTTT
jgi:hypothetical protein